MVKAMTYWSASSEIISTSARERGYTVDILNEEKNLYSIENQEGKKVFFKVADG